MYLEVRQAVLARGALRGVAEQGVSSLPKARRPSATYLWLTSYVTLGLDVRIGRRRRSSNEKRVSLVGPCRNIRSVVVPNQPLIC